MGNRRVNVEDLFRSPAELRFFKGLIYGDPGVGKTHLLGTAQLDPRTSPMLLIDFEGGSSTLAGLDIKVYDVRTWDDYNRVYAYLAKGAHPFKSVAIDSISETHWYALNNLLQNRPDDTRKVEDVSDQQEYGQALVQMRRLLREFRDLPMHVFYTAHAREELDPREGMVKKPSLAGKASNEVLGIVDVAGYLTFGKLGRGADAIEKRVLVLKNVPRIRAKTRTKWESAAPDEIIEPTVTALFDAVSIPHEGAS